MLRKIITVDDSELIHQMYSLMLRPYNCTLLKALNGKDALGKLATTGAVDLILLDINMPVMNGLQFLEQLRANPDYLKIPVIIISTEGHEEDVVRGLKMGANGYIVKPFNWADLHGLIQQLLNGGSKRG